MKIFPRSDYKWWFTWKEKCPFCNTENENEYKIFETKHWFISNNKYPYFWEKKHIMAIPKKHKKSASELSWEELKDFKNIEIFINNYFENKDYFSFIRQTTWWRSIEHLHYHYYPWILIVREDLENNFLEIT